MRKRLAALDWLLLAPVLFAVLFLGFIFVALAQSQTARRAMLDTVTLYACNAPLTRYQARDIDVHRYDGNVILTTTEGQYVYWQGTYSITSEARP